MAKTPRTTRTSRAHTTRASRAKPRSTRATTAAAVDGMEPVRDALNADIRVRVSGALLVAVAIIVVLLVLTAAAGASWLFAIPTIALAFVAGWLVARTTGARIAAR